MAVERMQEPQQQQQQEQQQQQDKREMELDCDTEPHQVTADAARVQLCNISRGMVQVSQRLERLTKQRLAQERAKVTGARWMGKALGRSAAFYDRLSSAKLRTEVGSQLANAERLVLQLDAVESNGVAEIRERRRSLVQRLNNKVIPRAEQAFRTMQRLVEMDRRISLGNDVGDGDVNMESGPSASGSDSKSDCSDSSKVHHHEESEHESEDESESEDEEAPAPAPRAPAPALRAPAPSPAPAAAEAPGPAAPRGTAQRHQRLREIQYEVRETPDAAVILCGVHPSVPLSRVQVSVDRQTGHLSVNADGHRELALDVSSPSLAPLKTSYKMARPGVLQVVIPRRRAPRPQRQARPQYHNRRPMFTAW